MGFPVREEDAKALQHIENITRTAGEVQNSLLAQILTQNAETEYLMGIGLNGAVDPQTFKSKVPMVTYEDIQPLIKRIANGDDSPILCARPIYEFISSSGTSGGEIKLFPCIKEDLDRRMHFRSLRTPVMNAHVKGLDKGKGLYFMFAMAEIDTPSGLKGRSGLTSFYKSAYFKERPYDPYNVFTTPNEAIYCEDTSQSMYTQMLCGLYEREQVLRVGMLFASGLIQAINFLQLNWERLTHDIRTGSLNPDITDPPIRECMARIMRPDPQLADVVAHECASGNWERIIPRIWPKAIYLDTVVSGAMAQYIPTLDYYSGGLPIVCLMYVSSEGLFGINLNPLCEPSEVSYTIMPNMAYFEFLPHNNPDCSELVDLTSVEIGMEYEIVVTTLSGLYRYQVGDVLRATGFYNSSPQFRFVKRKNMVLNVDVEKTDETELQFAVDKASQLIREVNGSMVDYTSYADTKTIPGHYVIYWEVLMQMGSNYEEVLAKCCLVMEESLNAMYRRFRVKKKLIGPLEIKVVRKGTFEELMEHAISNGASINQYKVPKCVNSKAVIDLLESRVISRHFSPSLPHFDMEFCPENWIVQN